MRYQDVAGTSGYQPTQLIQPDRSFSASVSYKF
ncbi:hypothetical protein SVI_2663 [Shewanella violacea DSS12]|uniref:Uncharacterized protein n=1 Tax=Shewanella violacea (strain JCM 10179 / CIP 106290 / LMG 19151 / DSS12) TaxID=637905 RepID=D4ZLT4_SHEVD|nr:hypothetical protein SVI_2662 [Shewanella violacea DSS12]BAJ02634.1 hypothetical protein SVI_2663 [Shewanella violacea DSS12]